MNKWITTHKKSVLAGTGVLVILAVLLGIFYYQKNNTSAQETMDIGDSANQAAEIDAWGEVKYTHMEDISIDFLSVVTDILVKEGERVTLGQPLVTLDLSEYNGNVEKLNQQLTAGQAALPAAKQGITALQADIKQLQEQIARKTQEYNSGTNVDLKLLQSSLNLARKQLATAKSDLKQHQLKYNNDTNADLKLLQNSLDLANKELKTAKNDLYEFQSLYDAGAISKDELDQYTNALDQRQKAVKDIKYNLEKTKTALKDEIDMYEDALDQRQKAVNDIQDNIQKTKTALKDELDQLNVSLKSKQVQLTQVKHGNTANITKQQSGIGATQVDLDSLTAKTAKEYIKGNQIVSNIKNGIVLNIMVSDASHLGAQGMPTQVLQIIDGDSLTVSAEVDEEFISNVEVGETVKIVPISVPDVSLTGTVTQIPSLAVEKDGKRVIRVLVKPDDPDNLLKPGYTADVYFKK
ncbi:HlyD family secretion protein [Anaerocolumna sp. MB42-C2]|uniref:HlyD family secretion protein n=1 Tax=Anaerocolumna sp. MB42-C2 TaxID=3070997 RepID=UPI0027E1F935|nr:efflux RND transporter periplasmic adaptor subunit [Anaerocolumna sp. MB42-C2]WMJ90142.1 HlyD family efflux transporter periplasmic adaptor subunit [Anaerocolumna sp. MB42-C2]